MRQMGLVVIVLSVALLSGCSSKLGGDEARKSVEAFERFRQPYTEGVHTYADDRFHSGMSKALRDLGYAEKSTFRGYSTLLMTDKGKAQSWETRGTGRYLLYEVPVAHRKVESVSVANLGEGAAEAEVKWRWELTEVGRAARGHDKNAFRQLGDDEAETTIFVFRKYDDGWRPTTFRRASDGYQTM